MTQSDNGELGPAAGTSLANVANGIIQAYATPTSLKLGKEVGIDMMEPLAQEIGVRRSANYWWWIDLMEYMGKFGERYEMIALYSGWSAKRAENILAVGQQFKQKDRTPGLTFAHYEAVCIPDLPYKDRLGILRMCALETKSAGMARALAVEKVRLMGGTTRRKIKGADVVDDPAEALDEQAETIRKQQAEIDRLKIANGDDGADDDLKAAGLVEDVFPAAEAAVDEDADPFADNLPLTADNMQAVSDAVTALDAYVTEHFSDVWPEDLNTIEFACDLLGKYKALRDEDRESGAVYLDTDDYDAGVMLVEQYNLNHQSSLTLGSYIGGILKARYEAGAEESAEAEEIE